MTTLQEKLEELMVARDQATETSLALKDAKDHWWANTGYHLQEIADSAKNVVAEAEAEIKEMALAVYHETQNKNPTPGVAIRMNRLAVYDDEDAFAWALEHQLALVPESLNEKEYKNLVLNKHAPGEVKEEPVAQIARDLAKALKED